jgi:hypothetical protein
VLACGVLVYNEIVVIPYFGFDKNTKIAIEERSGFQKAERTSIAYLKQHYLGENTY